MIFTPRVNRITKIQVPNFKNEILTSIIEEKERNRSMTMNDVDSGVEQQFIDIIDGIMQKKTEDIPYITFVRDEEKGKIIALSEEEFNELLDKHGLF